VLWAQDGGGTVRWFGRILASGLGDARGGVIGGDGGHVGLVLLLLGFILTVLERLRLPCKSAVY
jgi:hypothetical protein